MNDGGTVLGALDFEQRYRTSFRDALIIHAAHEAGADVLSWEDLSDGHRSGDLRVVSPLAG